MFLHLGDIVVHAAVEGPTEAPPLLMLHSIGTTMQVFEPQVAVLARTHRVIRMDLRGHGLTSVTDGDYSMELHASDALALLDALGVREAHVLGMSIGGRIAMQLAAMAPERVLSLMLMDTALEFPPPQAWQDRIDAVREIGTEALVEVVMPRWVVDPSLASSQGMRQMLLRTDRRGYAGSAAALRDARAAQVAGRIACPTTVMVGDRDVATPPELAKEVQAAIPGSRYVEISEAGHLPTLERADQATAAILEHFATLAPAAGRDAGLAIRKSVLGEAHVARASANVTALDAPFQDWITANVWGGIWTRPGLTRHTRSLLCIGMMAALARHEELELHLRATRNTGVTPEEVGEVLLQVGAYAGVPTANAALKIAKAVLKEE
ncbi:alpha/beta fold hydrolase [Falsiroseomonas sp.]|uniref:bifunctional 3-oxoadipate enol-lactonase/4-carboxymuconolactone decarboxylase PcaDC n=1 Tax=Falsiroseomonas sp. TaxID=2870721 RepID=UPI002719B1CD|nr:alpha/beta fold hydrolase [Falsiroseomonas sp.]MDO9498554.1 alpha/beta fold hydrolase [Falsiroseomonas sp.]MDP3417792.1 alpha/beta fold hydrolase [Falsiroseomonas sp.]